MKWFCHLAMKITETLDLLHTKIDGNICAVVIDYFLIFLYVIIVFNNVFTYSKMINIWIDLDLIDISDNLVRSVSDCTGTK